jgi:hypothetical protein
VELEVEMDLIRTYSGFFVPQEVPRNREVPTYVAMDRVYGHSAVSSRAAKTKDAGGEREEERGYTSVKG